MSDVTPEALRDYAEEAERTKDEPLSANATRPNRHRAKIISVRLNPEELDELVAYAKAQELPLSTLVRGMILRELRAESESSPVTTVDRIAQEVQQLRRQLASEGRGPRSHHNFPR